VAVGRDNRVFFGSHGGGKDGAILPSFTGCCLRAGVDPFPMVPGCAPAYRQSSDQSARGIVATYLGRQSGLTEYCGPLFLRCMGFSGAYEMLHVGMVHLRLSYAGPGCQDLPARSDNSGRAFVALPVKELMQLVNGVFEGVMRHFAIFRVLGAVNGPMSDCNVQDEIGLVTVPVTFCLGESHLQ
jgi:hypothetical protein